MHYRPLQLWKFTFTDQHGNDHLVCKKQCKRPALTDIWKRMQHWLNEAPFANIDIKTIGFELVKP